MTSRLFVLTVLLSLGAEASALAQAAPASTSAAAPSVTAPAPAPAAVAPKPVAGRFEWAVDSSGAAVKPSIGSLDNKNKDGYLFQIDLATQGASVYTAKLAEYFATVDDLRLFNKLGRDEPAYEQAAALNRFRYRGHYSLLNPVVGGATVHLPMATRGVRISGPGIEPLKWDLMDGQWKVLSTPATVVADGQSLSMAWTLYRDPNFADATKPPAPAPFLRLVKTYTLQKNSYSLQMSLKAENLSGQALEVAVDQAGPTGVPEEPPPRADIREAVAGQFKFADGKIDMILKRAEDLKKATLDQSMPLGNSKDGLLWVGLTNKYFGSMMYLVSPRYQASPKPEDVPSVDYRAEFYVLPVTETATSRTWTTGINLPRLSLPAGGSQEVRFDIFVGPKNRDLLDNKAPGGQPLYADLHYIGVIDLTGGSCSYCTFSFLTFGMMWLLEKFAYLSFGNFGVAIIILVILVRVALHPLTKKGQVSMSKMQKLGPEMQKIKEKYANDKETLNREMMKAYKQQGATPILGCLPMLLQMPIWVALWTALSNSIELRHAPFLPVWIVDLSAPDSLVSFPSPFTIPLLGLTIHGLNLLPLLLTVAMFLQTKLTPTAPATTPEARTQQKMMMYMMPAMMLFIFYSQPSGLTLYIMASTFAGVAEQYVIKKHIKEKEAQEAASGSVVAVPGRGPRGGRAKKPKGPFWTKHG